MKHAHRILTALLLVVALLGFALGGSSCKPITPESLTPPQRTEAEAIAARDAEAKAAQSAATTADEKAAADALAAKVEQEKADFEAKVLQERAGPIIGAVSAIDPRLGWVAGLMPLVPLLGKRGRKNFWNAIQNVNPWGNLAPGEPPHVAPIEAAKDLLRMWGVLHSTPEGENALHGKPGAPFAVATLDPLPSANGNTSSTAGAANGGATGLGSGSTA